MLRIKDSDEVGKMENSTKGKKKKKKSHILRPMYIKL